MLISSAYAQAAAGASDLQTQLLNFAPMIAIIAVFYFLLFRPQQQKAKQIKAQQASMRRGDRIVTAGGIIATVSRVINDDELEIQIAENVRVRVVRSTVTTVLAKPEPASGAKEPAGDAATSDNSDDDAAKKRRSPSNK